MPRFFFNAFDGLDLPDDEGVVLPNLIVARTEAMRFAGALLDERANEGIVNNDWHLEVSNDEGLVLLRFDFHITEPPTISLTKMDDDSSSPALPQELRTEAPKLQ